MASEGRAVGSAMTRVDVTVAWPAASWAASKRAASAPEIPAFEDIVGVDDGDSNRYGIPSDVEKYIIIPTYTESIINSP